MDTRTPHPYAGSWEGPWEGRNSFWMYPLQGQAWLQIEPDGAVTAEISISPGGERSSWQGQMEITGEIELEARPAGSAEGSAHGEAEILPSGRLQVSLIIGGIRPVPFDAQFELTRRQERGRAQERSRRDRQGFLQGWRERLKLRRLLRLLIIITQSTESGAGRLRRLLDRRRNRPCNEPSKLHPKNLPGHAGKAGADGE